MKKRWKLDNKGMTLLEVIVAFAIFAIAATILITGFNGALKVMGNSEAIKNASQGNASGLEIAGSPLDEIEGVTVDILEGDPDYISFGSYSISGVFRTATSNKKNDGMEMSLKMFEPDTKVLVTPTVPTPSVIDEKKELPIPNRENAYYNDRTQGINNQVFMTQSDGRFDASFFSEYQRIKGKTQIRGVVTETQKYPGNLEQGPNSNVQQLYFIAENPMEFSDQSGSISYAVKFLNIGNPDTKSSTQIKVNLVYQNPSQRTFQNRFVLKSYENNLDTILYLPKDLILTTDVICYDDKQNTPIFEPKTIQAGYYRLPGNGTDGTDILKAAYDDNFFYKFKNEYKVSYNEIKDYLRTIDVIFE